MMVDCALCGNPFYAPHSSTCPFYTPDVHRVESAVAADTDLLNTGGDTTRQQRGQS